MTPKAHTAASYIERTPGKASSPMAADSSPGAVHAWINSLVTKTMATATRAESLVFGGLVDGESLGDLLHTVARDIALTETRAQIALEVFDRSTEAFIRDPSTRASVVKSLDEIRQYLDQLKELLQFLRAAERRALEFPS